MKILEKDLKNSTLKIKPENISDLYILSKIIYPGDEVFGNTSRRVHKIGTIERSGDKGERISIQIRLEVIELYFTESSNSSRLRIRGRIKTATDDRVSLNSWHTMNLEKGNIISIKKVEWLKYHFDLLEEAKKAINLPKIILISIEMGKSTIAVVDNFQSRTINKLRIRIPRKTGDSKKREIIISQFFNEILNQAKRLHQDTKGKIMIGGPNLTRQAFIQYIRNKDSSLLTFIIEEDASSGDERGIREMINRGALEKLATNYLFIEERKLINKFLYKIQTSIEEVGYGLEGIKEIVNLRAIDTLLLTDRLIRIENPEERDVLTKILQEVEKGRGRIYVVDFKSENGEILSQFGEIIALLRYAIHL